MIFLNAFDADFQFGNDAGWGWAFVVAGAGLAFPFHGAGDWQFSGAAPGADGAMARGVIYSGLGYVFGAGQQVLVCHFIVPYGLYFRLPHLWRGRGFLA